MVSFVTKELALRKLILYVLPIFGAVSISAAQSPRITPAGDPSVRNDTIHSLVVNAADHPEESYIYLLDDGVLRFEADGRASKTYRQVIQILDRDAVETWGEQTFGYFSSREKLTINWARVLRPDGTVISEKPAHEQVFDAPVPESAPIFTDRKLHRISLSGVEPGTIVDYSYTIETLEPVLPGDFYTGWSVTTGRTTRRSRLILDVPAKLEPRIQERNLGSMRKVQEVAGRRIYTWAAADVERTERQLFAARENTVNKGLTIAGWVSWADVARWYHSLSADRYTLTPAIEAALAEVVKGAKTREDSLRAVHRWVAQDFRYVSLSLGIGGYQPRTPAEVFETKLGDCKDKATLFVAVARKMGFRAYPVLIQYGGYTRRELPSLHQFDHMIAAVATDTGYIYLDLTAELTPFGEIPPALEGEFGLLVREDGTAEELEIPETPRGANRSMTRLVGELDASGTFKGRYEETMTGSFQYAAREVFSVSRSERERNELARVLANTIIRGARGDSLVIFDGNDLTAVPRISINLSNGSMTRSSGNTEILTLPMPSFSMERIISQLEGEGERRYPFDVESVIGWHELSWEFEVTLPEGWRAQLPANVDVKSAFGEYSSEYTQNGRVLRVVRRLAGAKGTEPPSAKEALIQWLRAISADAVPYIVLEKPAAVVAGS